LRGGGQIDFATASAAIEATQGPLSDLTGSGSPAASRYLRIEGPPIRSALGVHRRLIRRVQRWCSMRSSPARAGWRPRRWTCGAATDRRQHTEIGRALTAH